MSKRTHRENVDPVVVMVRMVVEEDGLLTVTIDGAAYLPPEFSSPWRRSSFPVIVDAISSETGRTLRIDVIETDGRVITDFRTPPKPQPIQQGPAPQPPTALQQLEVVPVVPSAPLRFTRLVGSGFLPGEEVAVAVVIAHTEAGPDGVAHAMIDSRYLDHAPHGEVVLHGHISGAVWAGKTR